MVSFLENMTTMVPGTGTLLNCSALIVRHVDRSPSASAMQCRLLPNVFTEGLQCCTATRSIESQNEHTGLVCISTRCEGRNSDCSHIRKRCSAHQNTTAKMRERKFLVRATNGATMSNIYEGTNGRNANDRTALVWFKRDLRVDDHPGLLAASTYSKVLPLYVFDPVLLAGWSPELVEALRDAVLDLRKSLQNIDSDLVIRFERTEDALRAIAREVHSLDIFTEEEVEMEWHQLVRSVSASLSKKTVGAQDTAVKQWRSSIYEIESFETLPDCYKKFQELKYPIAEPLDPLSTLPCLPRNFDRGVLPSAEEISSAIMNITCKDQNREALKATQEIPAEVLLGVRSQSKCKLSSLAVQKSSGGVLKDLIAWREKYILASPYEALEKRLRENGPVLQEEEGYVLKGGATGALNILKGYLRFLEPTGRDDWQELYKHVGSLEERPGASFRALFGNALALGILSLRRVYKEAIEYEKARGGGWLSPFGFSSHTAAAALRDSKAIEWYQLLALKSREQGREQGFLVGTWRWRGFLVQYAVAGKKGPPVVFVHGFGAFWQHWRDNIKTVAESGHRVFALTMLGFGRSEKPLITYSDLLWAELVRDFTVEVVREPVVLAGNSIGGYTVSVVAGLWPSLVKSVVLLNSAGRVIPNYGLVKYNKPRETSRVAYVGARLLLAYLQNLSNGMLTKCYPTVLSLTVISMIFGSLWILCFNLSLREVTLYCFMSKFICNVMSNFITVKFSLNQRLNNFIKVLAFQASEDEVVVQMFSLLTYLRVGRSRVAVR